MANPMRKMAKIRNHIFFANTLHVIMTNTWNINSNIAYFCNTFVSIEILHTIKEPIKHKYKEIQKIDQLKNA